jgi:hypothetical protein
MKFFNYIQTNKSQKKYRGNIQKSDRTILFLCVYFFNSVALVTKQIDNYLKMEYIVVLTGAGMSAENGISTFRDSNGLWENYDVMKVAAIDVLFTTAKYFFIYADNLISIIYCNHHFDFIF